MNSYPLEKQPNQFTHPWTKKEIKFIEKNIKKLTYRQMGSVINRSPASIQSKVRYLPFQQKVKKYPIDRNFFKKWSPEMAYVLGFTSADGNMSKHGNAHMLQLACDDRDVIEKIKTAMKAEIPIRERPRFNGKISYQLRVSDRTIFYDLANLGLTPRKSLTLKPAKVPKKYLNHYLRGFFDGDGSVSYLKRSKLTSRWYTASKKMALFLYRQIRIICPDFKGKIGIHKVPNGDKNYYVTTLNSRDSKIMYHYLYKDAAVYMERKYQKFLQGLYA